MISAGLGPPEMAMPILLIRSLRARCHYGTSDGHIGTRRIVQQGLPRQPRGAAAPPPAPVARRRIGGHARINSSLSYISRAWRMIDRLPGLRFVPGRGQAAMNPWTADAPGP